MRHICDFGQIRVVMSSFSLIVTGGNKAADVANAATLGGNFGWA
jgi:hypothetical protein